MSNTQLLDADRDAREGERDAEEDVEDDAQHSPGEGHLVVHKPAPPKCDSGLPYASSCVSLEPALSTSRRHIWERCIFKRSPTTAQYRWFVIAGQAFILFFSIGQNPI